MQRDGSALFVFPEVLRFDGALHSPINLKAFQDTDPLHALGEFWVELAESVLYQVVPSFKENQGVILTGAFGLQILLECIERCGPDDSLKARLREIHHFFVRTKLKAIRLTPSQALQPPTYVITRQYARRHEQEMRLYFGSDTGQNQPIVVAGDTELFVQANAISQTIYRRLRVV